MCNDGPSFEALRELRLEADRVDIARAGQTAIIFIPAARIDDRPAVNLIVRLTPAAESRLVAQLAGGAFGPPLIGSGGLQAADDAAPRFERNYPADIQHPFFP